MGLTQETSLNRYAHFGPITCYQDYHQSCQEHITIYLSSRSPPPPLDVQGIRRTEQQQQQQPAASPGSRPAQVSPVRRRWVHQYGEAILPVPHPVTPPTSPTPAILPVPRPLMPPSSPVILPVRHSRPTAGMSTSRLPRILRDLQRE